MELLRWFALGALGMSIGCSTPIAPDSNEPGEMPDTTMSFSVDGDPSASVHVRKGSQRSRDDFGVMLRRGDAHREYWCVQWRSSDASETLHCGPFSLVRAPADQYSLRVDDVRNETILALTHGPSKQVRLTRRAEAQDSLAGVVAQRPRG